MVGSASEEETFEQRPGGSVGSKGRAFQPEIMGGYLWRQCAWRFEGHPEASTAEAEGAREVRSELGGWGTLLGHFRTLTFTLKSWGGGLREECMKICLQQLALAPFEKVDQRDAGDKPRATTQPSLDLGAGSEVGKCSGEVLRGGMCVGSRLAGLCVG